MVFNIVVVVVITVEVVMVKYQNRYCLKLSNKYHLQLQRGGGGLAL